MLDVVPERMLRYTHLSSVSQLPDVPDHHSVIAFELAARDGATAVRLVVERFATESIFRHLRLYWNGTLDVFKAWVERSCPQAFSQTCDTTRSSSAAALAAPAASGNPPRRAGA